MSWYSTYVLPKIIDRGMQGKEETAIRQEYAPRAKGVVLEVGAGSATNVPFYTNAVTKLYALEPSQELWNLGQGRVTHASFPIEHLHAKAEHIPLPNESVDTVVTAWALCSLNDPLAALKEMRRVLKPGGTYIFVDHGASPKPLWRAAQSALTPVSHFFTGNCHLDRKIDELIEHAGFTITSFEPMQASRPLVYLYRGEAVK